MRVPKEIIVLLVLLAAVVAFVLWYVADRKAKHRAEQNAPRPASTAPASIPTSTPRAGVTFAPHDPLDPTALNGGNGPKTIDFSSGKGVVKDTPEDRAAIAAALEDMAAAQDAMTFGPRKKAAPTATGTAPTPAEGAAPTPPKS